MRTIPLALVLGLVLGPASSALAADPPAVTAARKLWKRATADEKAGELTEHKVEINVGNRPVPGVGTRSDTVRVFVRTVEDEAGRAEHVVLVRYKAALAAYFNELNVLYDHAGKPRFAFIPGEDPLRFYWSADGALARFQRGESPDDKPSPSARKLAKAVHDRALRLREYGERLRAGPNAGPLFPEEWALLEAGE